MPPRMHPEPDGNPAPRGTPNDTPPGRFDPLLPDQAITVPGPKPADPADEREMPILHGNPYGPTGTNEAPNCQSGQVGFTMGKLLSPGQHRSNPAFGVYNIADDRPMPVADPKGSPIKEVLA